MTNKTKWLIALPFALILAFAVPAAIAGSWLWFAGDWAETLFVALTAGMWLAATGFVDTQRPRGPREITDNLIALGLVVAAPVAVFDRLYGPAAFLSPSVSIVGVTISTAAIALGITARQTLGQSYIPRAEARVVSQLVTTGPYRWMRHPMYMAVLLWATGWPMIIASLFGSIVALGFIFPALTVRMTREEADLRRMFGAKYEAYCARTRRLIPLLF